MYEQLFALLNKKICALLFTLNLLYNKWLHVNSCLRRNMINNFNFLEYKAANISSSITDLSVDPDL